MKGFYQNQAVQGKQTVKMLDRKKEELNPRRQRVNNKIQSMRQSFVAQTKVKPIKNKPAEPGFVSEQADAPKL